MVFYKSKKYPSWQTGKPVSPAGRLEYRKFRVRGHIKSFRDLEIYKQTTELCSQIYKLDLPSKTNKKKILEKEMEILRTLSKQVPKMIAESYGDKFTNRPLSYDKLERAMQYINNVITKLDFMIIMIEDKEACLALNKFIQKYQIQKRKILNLKRAWIRTEERFSQNPAVIPYRQKA